MADFKNLKVWEKAHGFSLHAVRASAGMNGVAGSYIKGQRKTERSGIRAVR